MAIDMTRKLPRPDLHHTVVPGLSVPNAAKVIAFIEHAFGGKTLERYDGPNGVIHHAEVQIGDSVVMLGDANVEQGMAPMPASLSLYVDNGEAVDRTYQRALAAGAKSNTEPKTQLYGYRSASVTDVGGNRWTICAVVELLTKEDIEKRMKDMPQ